MDINNIKCEEDIEDTNTDSENEEDNIRDITDKIINKYSDKEIINFINNYFIKYNTNYNNILNKTCIIVKKAQQQKIKEENNFYNKIVRYSNKKMTEKKMLELLCIDVNYKSIHNTNVLEIYLDTINYKNQLYSDIAMYNYSFLQKLIIKGYNINKHYGIIDKYNNNIYSNVVSLLYLSLNHIDTKNYLNLLLNIKKFIDELGSNFIIKKFIDNKYIDDIELNTLFILGLFLEIYTNIKKNYYYFKYNRINIELNKNSEEKHFYDTFINILKFLLNKNLVKDGEFIKQFNISIKNESYDNINLNITYNESYNNINENKYIFDKVYKLYIKEVLYYHKYIKLFHYKQYLDTTFDIDLTELFNLFPTLTK
jgi:hypothetical protein